MGEDETLAGAGNCHVDFTGVVEDERFTFLVRKAQTLFLFEEIAQTNKKYDWAFNASTSVKGCYSYVIARMTVFGVQGCSFSQVLI